MTPLPLHGSVVALERWWSEAREGLGQACFLLLLAATETAAVPGISAAGSTADARRLTAAADAELLTLGPTAARPHALPPLPAGVSPALISQVVCAALQLPVVVVDGGCQVAPAIAHLRAAGAAGARCLSSGRAMERRQVLRLMRWGRQWGHRWRASHPRGLLVIGECVAGGTSTAAAVLAGLGLNGTELVSGSLRQPPHRLRQRLLMAGLGAAGLPRRDGQPADPVAVLAAVGDPMQALAAGVVLEAMDAGPVLLAGGSQMAAVWAVLLALVMRREGSAANTTLAPLPSRPDVTLRQGLFTRVCLGTTRWVAQDAGSDLARLLAGLAHHWQLKDAPLALATSLSFADCRHQALRDYEAGYVKEGVGAGGLALLAECAGLEPEELARRCDAACASVAVQASAPG